MNSLKCYMRSVCFISVTGPDAETFLHGQLSNDVRGLDHEHSQLHAYCNAKGRAYCLLRIHRSGSGYVLQVPCELAETTADRLRRYVLRADVDISPLAYHSIGVLGDAAQYPLADLVGPLPTESGNITRNGDLVVLRLRSATAPRYQLVGPDAAIVRIWTRLDGFVESADEHVWWREEILAGLPSITLATTETFVPQMLNLDILDAVSFSKGCYPGQEIIARMRYLGKLKQRMHLVHGSSTTELAGAIRVPAPGTKVVAGKASVGTVVNAQPDDRGGCDLLIVLQRDQSGQSDLQIKDYPDLAITVSTLPYSLTDERQKQA